MNIVDIIRQETLPHRRRTAVIEGEARIGYGRLLEAADQVAASLREAGIGPLHRVGLLCDDSIDYIVASLAILSLSAVVVPVSPDMPEPEQEQVLERIDLPFLLGERQRLGNRPWEPFESPGFSAKEFGLVRRAVPGEPPARFGAINPAFIRFSSGTTGASKGVVLSHETIKARTDAADRALEITAGDTVLWVLSMSYHFVVTILLFLRRGATIVLCGRPFPEALMEGIIRHEGTFVYASPFHYGLLTQRSDLPADALNRIRLAVSTAMKLPEETATAFREKFGFDLTEAYGIIEVGLPFVRTGGDNMSRGSVGKALPDFRLRLDPTDDDGVGPIRISGPGILDAYYSPWRERQDILADGWFATGDLGRLDRDGNLFIAGREKDVINFVGMKIFAQEVEEAIDRHPLVRESLVFPVLHPRYGELPAAKIVLKDGPGDGAVPDDLAGFCYRQLASYKVPKSFEVVAELTRTPSGKLKRT